MEILFGRLHVDIHAPRLPATKEPDVYYHEPDPFKIPVDLGPLMGNGVFDTEKGRVILTKHQLEVWKRNKTLKGLEVVGDAGSKTYLVKAVPKQD